MIKLLITMAALTIVSTTATTVIACSDKNMIYYTRFMDGVKNKENFILMISAKNCIHCQNTHDTTIADLYSNMQGNEKFNDYLTGKFGSQYQLSNYPVSDEQQEKIKKTRLIVVNDIKDYNGVWQQKWAKKIADWIITQERNAHKINDEIDKSITAASLGLNGTPTYIYVKNGNYVGFETDEIGNLETGPNSNLWMQRFIEHMVLEDWDTDHNKKK